MMAKRNNPCRSYLVSQIINLPLSKIAFPQVENKTILHLEVKYHIEMFEVEVSSLTCQQNIVQLGKELR